MNRKFKIQHEGKFKTLALTHKPSTDISTEDDEYLVAIDGTQIPEITIQAGLGYYIVGRAEGEGDDWCIYNYPTRSSLRATIPDVIKALGELAVTKG